MAMLRSLAYHAAPRRREDLRLLSAMSVGWAAPWHHQAWMRQSLHQEAPSRAPHHCQPQPTEPARRFGSYPKMDVRGRSARYHALTRLCERAQHRHRCQPCVSACASAFGGSPPKRSDRSGSHSSRSRSSSAPIWTCVGRTLWSSTCSSSCEAQSSHVAGCSSRFGP